VSVVKKRALPCLTSGVSRYKWRQRDYQVLLESDAGSPQPDSLEVLPHLQGSQVTESENHPDWKRNNISPPGDMGGNFTSTRRYAIVPTQECHLDTGWTNRNLQGIQYRYIYDGPICIQEVTESSTSFPPYAQSSDAQLNAYGATAIAQCAPTKPTANLATSLLEVYREGLPKLIGKDLWSERTQSAMALPKASGGEFLNYQFGVLPLVADIQDFVKAVRNLDRLLQQFARDNGNVVRRRFVFKPTIDVVEVSRQESHLSPIGEKWCPSD